MNTSVKVLKKRVLSLEQYNESLKNSIDSKCMAYYREKGKMPSDQLVNSITLKCTYEHKEHFKVENTRDQWASRMNATNQEKIEQARKLISDVAEELTSNKTGDPCLVIPYVACKVAISPSEIARAEKILASK